MKYQPDIDFRKCFKIFFYLLVFYGFSVSYAGSYDDFFAAVKRDDAATLSALLKRGFDANTLNPAGEPALMLAVREPSLKAATVLINWPKTKVEARNRQDESPLMLASLKGYPEICLQLIARGADVNKPGWAPLHYAATHGHLAVLTLLLDNYAYIDAASPNGTTPLMMASHYGTPAAVKLLLDAGADPLLKNIQGLTAIDFAYRANRTESAEMIAAFVRSRQPKGTW
ncbi:MAG: ankyrin repeat domain-containing protein [Sulfuriferula multivorans]|uniref:Ankyrin repeat domain-containing protein n=1 Tax=Sulfuriferula multivorans TaxID=1559896 RepID=A0A7C9TBM1_9PROT|nr:ankyrin repeat domain-containing protein [Sulfuriferula multivorans]